MSFCTKYLTNFFLKSSFITLTSSSDFSTLSLSTSFFFTLLPGSSIFHNLTFLFSASSAVKSSSLTLKYLSSFIYIALNAYSLSSKFIFTFCLKCVITSSKFVKFVVFPSNASNFSQASFSFLLKAIK